MWLLLTIGLILTAAPDDADAKPAEASVVSGTSNSGAPESGAPLNAAATPSAPPAETTPETGASPSGAPEELKGLLDMLHGAQSGGVAHSEEELAQALRRFDRLQQSLADWDETMAKDLASTGQKELAEARMAQRQKRFDLIQTAYTEFLKYYPKNPKALNYYGEFLYDRKGDMLRAIQYWRWAAAIDSKFGAPRNNLAIHYCHVGDYEMGLHYFDEALKLGPKNPDYLYNLAQVYLTNSPQVAKRNNWKKDRVYKEAMKLSKKAADLAPNDLELVQDYAVNFFAAENFGIEADWPAAAKAWQRARACAREKDDVFYTWLNEGRVWLREKDNARAAECLGEALKLQPDSDVTKKLLEEAGGPKPADTTTQEGTKS